MEALSLPRATKSTLLDTDTACGTLQLPGPNESHEGVKETLTLLATAAVTTTFPVAGAAARARLYEVEEPSSKNGGGGSTRIEGKSSS